MGRSGYSDDIDDPEVFRMNAMWRGQVASAVRGKRGQAFLIELVRALDALPEKKLIANDLVRPAEEGDLPPCVCAIGSVGLARGVDMTGLDPYDAETLSGVFGIAHQLVQEIEFMNDEAAWRETPEARWSRMRAWAISNLTPENRTAIAKATGANNG